MKIRNMCLKYYLFPQQEIVNITLISIHMYKGPLKLLIKYYYKLRQMKCSLENHTHIRKQIMYLSN